MADLTAYTSVKTALFVRIQVDEYRVVDSSSYISEVLRFSDHDESFVIDGETYTPLGELLGVTASTSELRPSSDSVSITLSGIPQNSIGEIVYSKIKGAPVRIYRGWFDVATGNLIGSIEGRFFGSVNNYGIQEDYEVVERQSSSFIELECASTVGVLARKTAGRKTNPKSQKRFYPNDLSMDRVPSLRGQKFNFGEQ